MRVGISGHQRLGAHASWEWVREEVYKFVARTPPPLIGVTSLAVGADQLFARVVLQLRGALEVVVPLDDYETKFSAGRDRQEYLRLLRRASKVDVLRTQGSDEQAYLAAGQRVADVSDILIVVWDGKAAAGLGGTGDIVAYARRKRKAILQINPINGEVSSA